MKYQYKQIKHFPFSGTIGRIINIKFERNWPRASTGIAEEHFNGELINAVEIGTNGGVNAKNILKHLNINKIYLVDPYINNCEYLTASNYESKAHKTLKRYSNKVIFIKKYSSDALKDIKGIIDFVYVDGSHMYDSVKEDLNNYYPLVRKSGIIAGHDICNHQGVSDAIIEFCYEHKLHPIFCGEDWIIIKELKEK